MEKIAGDESEILEPFETTSDTCFLAGSKLVPKSRIHELKNRLDCIIINSAEPTHSKSHINVGAV